MRRFLRVWTAGNGEAGCEMDQTELQRVRSAMEDAMNTNDWMQTQLIFINTSAAKTGRELKKCLNSQFNVLFLSLLDHLLQNTYRTPSPPLPPPFLPWSSPSPWLSVNTKIILDPLICSHVLRDLIALSFHLFFNKTKDNLLLKCQLPLPGAFWEDNWILL